MCGFAGGYFSKNNFPIGLLNKMSSLIKHRGPDQSGYFVSKDNHLAITHLRLSIHDLSDAGRQPMESFCGRFVIAFNGEIYNFKDLKKQLKKSIFWRGNSDTEVLVNAISTWGLEKTLPKLNGMFAFVLFDRLDNTVSFARDRFGEKPLYIYSDSNGFAFSSELRPIEEFTNQLSINQNSVNALFQYSYIPSPFSIYNEVFKLPAGSYIRVSLEKNVVLNVDKANSYWSVADAVSNGILNQSNHSDYEESCIFVEDALKKSVFDRMSSDVPLGAFLSGGIDSTCIAALMQTQSKSKIKTFSIGFNDDNYNEAHHAKAVAKILGTEHHEMYLEPSDMLNYVPKLSQIYDEPFADSSQLPTLMVSQFAKKHVTVALTGDAGDEVFSGYNRYKLGNSVISNFGKIPLPIRKGMSIGLTSISPVTYTKILSLLSILMPRLRKHKRIGDNVHKFGRILGFSSEADLYQKLILVWPQLALTCEVVDIATDIQEAFNKEDISFEERMMWQDSIGYMHNDILTKVDRASMASSLEARVPFLDNEVFDLAWSLPIGYKLRNGETKAPLRKIVSNYVPNELMNRPKAGFGVPIDSWLRNELNDWAENLLSIESLGKSQFLDVSLIRRTWKNHLIGNSNEQYGLWNVLMYQQWMLERR